MAAEQSERIKLWGIVQGVGFRPYVAKTAELLGMKGEVLNIGGLVEITVTDTPSRITSFISHIIENRPAPAEIVHIRREPVLYREFSSFSIIKSDEGTEDAAMLPADLAICPDCLKELYSSDDRRYAHPFISCMVCGPRYTIIDKIPYDRINTSMTDFPMCGLCEEEYTDLHDRRYHAQTISCNDCGPQLHWHPSCPDGIYGSVSEDIPLREHSRAVLDTAASVLEQGSVIAFKSTGGYNLVCDPLNDRAVEDLRRIKGREAKPFAVMFRSIEEIRRFCRVSPSEEALLSSSARPVILLEHKDLPYREFMNNRFTGAFLPSLGAQYLLLDRISPLIFTSANISGMPMIKDDSAMMDMTSSEPLIRGVVSNERDIRIRADDSVVRVIDDQPQMIRRSKGYAPVPLYIDIPGCSGTDTMIFAAGSQLKNSFALTKGPFTYISQYFGDMDTIENQTIYEENTERLSRLFRIKPTAVVCDRHPLYFTTAFAERYAEKNGLPLIKVQHHHAHVASVMAENNIQEPVIGVSFDGTGYGDDGCVWGGEFFICEKGSKKRISHLRYVNMTGGDSSVKDARRSALGYINAFSCGYLSDSCICTGSISEPDGSREIPVDISDIIEYGKDDILSLPEAPLVTAALKAGINTVCSSSMGRLFDGVSALLGIQPYNEYEGQCAIMLEDAAAYALAHPGEDRVSDLALSFHDRIIDMILDECMNIRDEYGVSLVALTGGTFQNRILMEGILAKLRSHGFTPFYNISVSPNDGGIALGQAYIAMHELAGDDRQ